MRRAGFVVAQHSTTQYSTVQHSTARQSNGAKHLQTWTSVEHIDRVDSHAIVPPLGRALRGREDGGLARCGRKRGLGRGRAQAQLVQRAVKFLLGVVHFLPQLILPFLASLPLSFLQLDPFLEDGALGCAARTGT